MEMNSRRISVLLAFVVIFSACVAFPATVLTPNTEHTRKIKSCTTINKPGKYELTKNITNGGGTRISQSCLEIHSGNVILDGEGHTIDGRGNSHTIGINVTTLNNNGSVEIRDIMVTNWHKGIAFRHGDFGQLRNIQASSNVYGISIENAQLVVTRDNSLKHNLIGMNINDKTITIQLIGNKFSANNVDKV